MNCVVNQNLQSSNSIATIFVAMTLKACLIAIDMWAQFQSPRNEIRGQLTIESRSKTSPPLLFSLMTYHVMWHLFRIPTLLHVFWILKLQRVRFSLITATPSPNSYVPTPSPGQPYQPSPSPGYAAPSPGLGYSPMTPGSHHSYTPGHAAAGDALGSSVKYHHLTNPTSLRRNVKPSILVAVKWDDLKHTF